MLKVWLCKTIMNRRRYIPELKSPIYHVRQFGKRTAMNAQYKEVQPISLKAMVDLDEYLVKNKLNSKILYKFMMN